jgi:hypothetical protein
MCLEGNWWIEDIKLPESTPYTDNASKYWEQYIDCTAAGSEQGRLSVAVIRLREHATHRALQVGLPQGVLVSILGAPSL